MPRGGEERSFACDPRTGAVEGCTGGAGDLNYGRSAMGRRLLLVLLAATVVLTAGACVGKKGGNDSDPLPPQNQVLEPTGPIVGPTTPASTAPATTPATAAPTSTTAASSTTTAPTKAAAPTKTPGPPFAVGVVTATYVDPTRPTAARGGVGGAPTRTLKTIVRYPSSAPVGTPEGGLPPATGPFPLLVFAHGFNIDTAAYADALRGWAAAGYVVAAPELPLTSTALPGPAVESDLPNQPADLGVVITNVLAASNGPGPFSGLVDPARIAVVGHSDGGNTVAAIAANSCCRDPRVKAVVAYAPEQAFFPSTWFGAANPPLLVVHATADSITAYSRGKAIYDGAAAPKYLLTIQGGSHLGPLQDAALRAKVDPVVLDFLRAELGPDPAALAAMKTAGAVPPLTLTGSP